MDEQELRNLMYTASIHDKGPFSIRYPRGNGVMTDWKTAFKEIKIGQGRKVTAGEDIAILTIGHPGNFAQEAIEQLKGSGVSVAHYDMRFVKPLDETLLREIAARHALLVAGSEGNRPAQPKKRGTLSGGGGRVGYRSLAWCPSMAGAFVRSWSSLRNWIFHRSQKR
jgi:deoxyxylulose-5-phosphate synthase